MIFRSNRVQKPVLMILVALSFLLSGLAHAQNEQGQAPDTNHPAAAGPSSGNAQEQMIGPWHAIFSVSDKGQNVTELRLPASRSYADKDGKEFIADFIVICRQKNTVVYIDMKKAIGSLDDETVPLQYASTGAFPTKSEWKLSSDRIKVLAPDPLDFITQIRDKQSLDFEITPYDAQAINVFFTLDSIEQAFELMSQRCYE